MRCAARLAFLAFLLDVDMVIFNIGRRSGAPQPIEGELGRVEDGRVVRVEPRESKIWVDRGSRGESVQILLRVPTTTDVEDKVVSRVRHCAGRALLASGLAGRTKGLQGSAAPTSSPPTPGCGYLWTSSSVTKKAPQWCGTVYPDSRSW